MRRALLPLLAALLAALVLPGAAGASVTLEPAGFQLRTVLSGLEQPAAVRFAPNGLVFVAEKRGTIQVFDGLTDTTATEVVNLRREVYNNGDRGLLSITVDPEFPARPYLYALYTRDASWAASTGATADDVPLHQNAGIADSANDDPDCGGQLYGALGCPVSGRLVRIQVNPVTGVKVAGTPPNPRTLVSGWCQQFSTHSVGDVRFGADGQLYLSGGDGAGYDTVDVGQFSNPCPDAAGEGGAMRAQDAAVTTDPTGLNGAILRVDPDTGDAATGNPFVSADPNLKRIIGYGLRNPYRFTFRPGTSDLWLGDVGWGRWEEIDRIPDLSAPARNFGWPCYEGDWQDNNPNYPYQDVSPPLAICHAFYDTEGAGITAPLFSYYHTTAEGNCVPTQYLANYNVPFSGGAVTGLAFYDGGDYPSAYDGGLFFADYARGCMWFMGTTNGIPDRTKVQRFASWDPGSFDPVYVPADVGVVGLERGPGGDIFVTDIANGTVRRLIYGAVDARISADVTSGPTPLEVNFDASASTTTGGASITRYEWDLDGDGSFETDTGTTATVSRTYATPGVINVKVRVTNSGAQTGVSDPLKIQAGNVPVAIIETPTDSAAPWSVGDQLTFSGKGYDGQGTPLPAASLTWDLIIRHCATGGDCHSHFVGGSLSGLDSGRHGPGGTFTAPDHSYPSHLELQLTVEDASGLRTTTSRRLDPATVDIALASDPAGRTLTGNDRTAPAPFICTVIRGSQATVSAKPSETAGGQTFLFDSWSNGGPATQTFTATADAALTARYRSSGAQQAPPPPAGQVPPPVKQTPVPAVRRGGTLRVGRTGIVALRVRCPGPGPCRASVRLTAATAAGGARPTRLALGFARRIAAKRATTLRVRLPASARRRLAARGSLQAIATVTVTPRGRPAVTTRTRYTLRPARR